MVLLVFAFFLAATILVGAGAASTGSCADAHGLMGPVGSCLRQGLLKLLGLPATILLPLVPAVHALRLFGRMRSDTDRSWMLFLAGARHPAADRLRTRRRAGARTGSLADGLWGSFVAYYLYAFFGPVGAWLVVSLLLCALTVLTLAWNPIRVLIGVRVQPQVFEAVKDGGAGSRPKEAEGIGAVVVPPRYSSRRRRRCRRSIHRSCRRAPGDIADDAARGKKKKRSRAELAAEHDERIAAAIDATDEGALGGDELPPPDLLTPAPPRNAELGKRELDAMGVEAHGRAAHLPRGGGDHRAHDGTGRDAVRGRARAGREGAADRQPRRTISRSRCARRASASSRRFPGGARSASRCRIRRRRWSRSAS